MSTIPKIVTLTNSSVDVLNAIRNSASQNYKNYVPKVTADADSLRSLGAIIMDNPALQNEFINAIVNRIAKVVITSRSYSNPWRAFKRGILEYGETIEEIFVELAKPFQYDPEVAESTQFKRQIPDVRSAFHIMNYQKFYKVTIEEERLRKAFLSFGGMSDLITYIINSLYNGAEYDEFQTMKYMIARRIIDGQLTPVSIPAVSSDNMKSIVGTIKATSNDFEFKSSEYNIAGVRTECPKSEQYIILSSSFDAKMDVEVLASAFNMGKAEFMGKRVLIDGFGKLDNERLAELFEHDPTYVEITEEQMTALNTIPAILVDREWFMIFDNLFRFKDKDNGEGLYWNYWYHVWKTFSVSPFKNNAIFIPATPTITSVSVSPATMTLSKGEKGTFTATVATGSFAPKTVDWTINSELSTIDNSGNLIIGDEETADTITVTATSTYDTTKTDTATVTIV